MDVLNLKKEVALHKNRPEEAKKYQKIIDKVSDLDDEEYKD